MTKTHNEMKKVFIERIMYNMKDMHISKIKRISDFSDEVYSYD